MNKTTGQEMKKDLVATEGKLTNLLNKIDRKFNLIIDEYQKYIPEDQKRFLEITSIYNLDDKQRLDIIIATEANYVKINGNQAELFN